VYKAIVKSTGSFVAVKQIEIDGLSKDQISGIKGEIETMKDLSHPNILCYLGTQQSPSRVFIFLEYADRGSLRQFYANRGPLTESQISFCLQGIVAGLNYLHENGIAHRDIKCANCLLGSEGVVKLADFGASKRFESDSIVSGLKGTPHWMAPEVIKGTQMTTGWMKADVWSLGCTVVEMFTAKVPYAEYENPMTAMYKIASGEIPALKPSSLQPNAASDEMISFIHTCCAVEPATRPSADALLTHDLLRREIGSLGDLFADLALPIIPPDNTSGTNENDIDANSRQSPMMTQFEKESHKIARRSLDGAAQLQAPIQAAHPHAQVHQRARSDSRSSVLSADDDDTTIANAAETSYLEDDFCSYGLDEISKSRSRGESLGYAGGAGIGVGIGIGEDANDETSPMGAEGPKEREPRIQARLSALSVPRAASTSRSSSRSRGQSRGGMVICTSSTGINTPGGNQDATAGSDLDDVATPSVFRDNGRSASMQMQMHLVPALGEQVSGITLSEDSKVIASTGNTSLSRKWSATAFPEKLLETMKQGSENPTTAHSVEHSPIEEEFEMVNDIHSPGGDEDMAEILEIPTSVSPPPEEQSGTKKTYVAPLVPSFEDASEVYKSMLLKYSPRASRDPSAAPEPSERAQSLRASIDAPTRATHTAGAGEEDETTPYGDDEFEGAEDEEARRPSSTADDSTAMLVSPVAEKPVAEKPVDVAAVAQETSSAKSADLVSSPSARSSKLSTQNSSAAQSPSNRATSSSKEKAKEVSPLVKKKLVAPVAQGGAQTIPSEAALLNEVQSSMRSLQSKPKPRDLGPLDAERLRAVVSAVVYSLLLFLLNFISYLPFPNRILCGNKRLPFVPWCPQQTRHL